MTARRLDILMSPWEATALPVGDPRRHDRYRNLQAVARVNIPRRVPAAARLSVAWAARDTMIDRVEWVTSS